eukprot:3933645-Rhodomonas_salina.1
MRGLEALRAAGAAELPQAEAAKQLQETFEKGKKNKSTRIFFLKKLAERKNRGKSEQEKKRTKKRKERGPRSAQGRGCCGFSSESPPPAPGPPVLRVPNVLGIRVEGFSVLSFRD